MRKTWKSTKNKVEDGFRLYSISNKLKKENKSSDEFEIMLNNLSLEEVIALKLELAFKSTNKLFGTKLWNVLPIIVKDAVLKYTYSAARSKYSAAAFLGMTSYEFNKTFKRYKTKSYFEEKNT